MNRQLVFALVMFSSIIVLEKQGSVEPSFGKLTYEDLKGLDGAWETTVNQAGWSGTLYLYITVYGPEARRRNCFLFMSYDGSLVGKEKTITIRNAAGRGVTFAGIRQGDVVSLVTQPNVGTRFEPIEVKLVPELMTPFNVNGNKLILDMSKSGFRISYQKRLESLDLTGRNRNGFVATKCEKMTNEKKSILPRKKTRLANLG